MTPGKNVILNRVNLLTLTIEASCYE